MPHTETSKSCSKQRGKAHDEHFWELKVTRVSLLLHVLEERETFETT